MSFSAEYGSDNNDKRTQHHEITGGKLCRMMNNARKLTDVFHGDPFLAPEDEDEIYNLLTKEVMTEKVSKDILERYEIGQRMFVEFATERLTEGRLCVWDKMTKKKLKTFKTSNATVEINAGGKLVKIKEERGLLQRLIVISRSRPQLDMKECIGTYEFGVVPRSLFASDGTVLLAYDKAKILHHLELLVSNGQLVTHTPVMETSTSVAPNNENGQEMEASEIFPDVAIDGLAGLNDTSPKYKVIIIDGMALVNAIPKTERIKTCKEFAQFFLDQLSNMADEYDEVRLVFDRYINSSLKEQMRRKRTKGKSTYYHVKDTTLIQNISLKDFLSNIKTKAELTTYLAAKTTDHSKGPTNKLKKFIVTSGTETKGNICVPPSLVTHSQEEADTLPLLHALSIDRHAEVVIAFLLMIQMYPSLPCNISFLTGKGNLKRNIPVQPVYNKLGHRRASAILGFHALTGSDISGRFAGRSKEWCFKMFMACDDDILNDLESLGHRDLSQEEYDQLERFVCQLYKSKVYTKVNEYRWFLYSNRAAEGERLPPTTGSLTLHIRRAHYVAMIWRKAGESHPRLPSPVDCGWEFDTTRHHYAPVRCLNPPAPAAVMNLV